MDETFANLIPLSPLRWPGLGEATGAGSARRAEPGAGQTTERPIGSIQVRRMTLDGLPADAERPRLDEIRQQIANGTYLDEAKLNVVCDELLEIVILPGQKDIRATA